METPSSSKRIIDEISTRFVDLVGAAFQVEEKVGLDKVMTGMNRSEAARFFFEVLDRKTRDFIEVEQVGDEIFIQKGSEW